MKAIYLDHAATTAVRPEVFEAMRPVLTERFGNPSSVHRWGRDARVLLETAREQVAAALGAQRREIVFTSGGTEANNLGVLGSARAAGCASTRVVVSAIEHKAVLGAAEQAAREGAELVVLAVDERAVVDLGALEHALKHDRTEYAQRMVCAVMWGNNEVGTIQPVKEIADSCRAAGAHFHVDAVQAFGRQHLRVDEVHCSTLAISGHKIGAAKGVGAVFVRAGSLPESLTHGGGQERALRPGTENLAGIVGLAAAAQLAMAELERESARLERLRDELQNRLCGQIAGVTVNGAGAQRLPHVLNVSFPGVEQETLLVALDLEGVAVSSGSACQSGSVEPSHVLSAMGRSKPSEASIRFSLGRSTSASEIEDAGVRVCAVVERLRKHQVVSAGV
ncbi:MAG: cysteine desulfurase family protein [Longimicrobiales bacterium]